MDWYEVIFSQYARFIGSFENLDKKSPCEKQQQQNVFASLQKC